MNKQPKRVSPVNLVKSKRFGTDKKSLLEPPHSPQQARTTCKNLQLSQIYPRFE